MTGEQYAKKLGEITDAFRHFVVLTLSVSDEDLVVMLGTVERAQAVGHIFDPTKYRDALRTGTLERQHKLLDLCTRVRAGLRELFPGDATFIDALQEAHRSEETRS